MVMAKVINSTENVNTNGGVQVCGGVHYPPQCEGKRMLPEYADQVDWREYHSAYQIRFIESNGYIMDENGCYILACGDCVENEETEGEPLNTK